MLRPDPVKALCAFVLAVGCAPALAACGSSGGASSSQTTAATGATTQPSTTTHTGTSGSGLSVTGTPKFAQPSSSEPVHSGTVDVAYSNITIQPDVLRVRVGSTVRWTNHDSIEHNVTGISGPQRLHSGGLHEGQSFAVKLTHPGTIHYECTNPPATMNGTIQVLK